MADAHFRVQVEKDHLKKLASADAIKALSELIWNSLDADATRVDVEIENDDIAMRSVTVLIQLPTKVLSQPSRMITPFTLRGKSRTKRATLSTRRRTR